MCRTLLYNQAASVESPGAFAGNKLLGEHEYRPRYQRIAFVMSRPVVRSIYGLHPLIETVTTLFVS